jgi:hypothetical protein
MTMTVVQEAPGLRDESTDHETYHDADAYAAGHGHMGARQKLAEKTKSAIEKLRDAAESPSPMHPIIPPVDDELSYDSSDEGGEPSGGPQHPQIHEEDIPAPHSHVDRQLSYSPSIQPSERFIVPFPVSTTPYHESEIDGDDTGVATATFPQNEQARTSDDAASHSSPTRLALPSKYHTSSLQEGASVLPSPAGSLNGHQRSYPTGSVTPSTRVATSSPLSSTRNVDRSADRMPPSVRPVEWAVEEVVDWLRSKGFDEMVCDKFTEQDITGDILFKLDLETLKSEIGIIAFGTRIRIANVIADLRRRPRPSIMSSSAGQHVRPRSSSQESSHARVGLPTARGSPIWSPESTPDSGNLMGRPVPVRRDTDPNMRSIRSVRNRRRSDGTVSNRRIRAQSNVIVGNGERPRVTSNPGNRTRVASNAGNGSNATVSNGEPSSPTSNGGNQLSAIRNGGNRSNATVSDVGDILLWYDYHPRLTSALQTSTKNLVTKFRSFLFGPPNS